MITPHRPPRGKPPAFRILWIGSPRCLLWGPATSDCVSIDPASLARRIVAGGAVTYWLAPGSDDATTLIPWLVPYGVAVHEAHGGALVISVGDATISDAGVLIDPVESSLDGMESAYRAVGLLSDQYRDLFQVPLQYSTAFTAMQAFRATLTRPVGTDRGLERELRDLDAIGGGRVEAWAYGGYTDDVFEFDLPAAYAHCLQEGNIPAEHLLTSPRGEGRPNTLTLAYVRGHSTSLVGRVRIGGKVHFPTGEFVALLTPEEVQAARILRVVRVYHFAPRDEFSAFGERLLLARQRHAWAKLTANSLVGKMIEKDRTYRYTTEPTIGSTVVAPCVFRVPEASEAVTTCVPAAVTVIARCRVKAWGAIQTIEEHGGALLSIDTDGGYATGGDACRDALRARGFKVAPLARVEIFGAKQSIATAPDGSTKVRASGLTRGLSAEELRGGSVPLDQPRFPRGSRSSERLRDAFEGTWSNRRKTTRGATVPFSVGELETMYPVRREKNAS